MLQNIITDSNLWARGGPEDKGRTRARQEKDKKRARTEQRRTISELEEDRSRTRGGQEQYKGGQ